MTRMFWIAWREFVATVSTKGFIIGIFITPTLVAGMIVVMPILFNKTPPKVVGEVAVVDPTGEVVDSVATYLAPEAMVERWRESKKKIDQKSPEVLRKAAEKAGGVNAALQAVLGEVPKIQILRLPLDADLAKEKKALLTGSAQSGGRLALAVVHGDAVEKSPTAQRFGNYDLFVREKLDDRIEDEIKSALRDAIVAGRIRQGGFDRSEIEALTQVGRVRSTTVTETGEQKTNKALNVLLPVGFMILLFISVMTGGQQILTTTVEEKSSRVVEVLLSAVSPMQLMAGKIVGQLCVGMIMLILYGGMGIAILLSFTLLGFIDLSLLLYLLIFYLIAYFTLGSMMAAIGSAVNEMSEAQGLMAPVMITMMVPLLLWLPITRDPNSVFATVTSFIPPINTFVMLLRMSSTTPPPFWQVWLSILVGVVGVYGALWFAAKVFRVGLLMFGKPPNLATLIRWVRMT